MKRSLLRLFSLLILLVAARSASAQSGAYGNEWIDYSKTYYKFKVGASGPCRIYRSALAAAGVPATVLGSNFMLYRDGKEVPVYVSAENMAASDYIEFWGKKADGLLDKELYLKASFQPDDRISLFTDTACYYLCYDGNAAHQRYAQATNAIPGGTLTSVPYILATSGVYARNVFSAGPTYYSTVELVSSEFDNGEGFVNAWAATGAAVSISVAAPNIVAGAGGTLHTAIVARASGSNHQYKVLVNNVEVADSSFGPSEAKHYDVPVPSAALSSSNTVTFQTSITASANDYNGIGFAELQYPRNLDMAGYDQLAAALAPTGAGQYLEFTNLGAGRLYDITNGKWYSGNTAVSGKTRFYLDPSFATRQILIVRDASSSVAALSPVKTIQFTNYSAASRQGNFVIISHTQLMQPTGGHSFVQEYADYRASFAGGGHTVATADVTELYDEFAYGYDIHPLAIKHFLQFAYNTWATKPADALLFGRGMLYQSYAKYRANPGTYPFPVVPTYGDPGSDIDFVLWGDKSSPAMRIGRVAAWTAGEVGDYLTKVQGYEASQPIAVLPTTATEMWKKRAMHVVGATSIDLQAGLQATLAAGAFIIADTLTGKNVASIAKSDNVPIAQANSAVVDSLLRTGVSLITFYGHGSPNNFDYNLPKPGTYTCGSRLPFLLALGCDVSQMFDPVPAKTLGELYIAAPNSGSIAFLASDNTSFDYFDDGYLPPIYHSIAHINYGAPLGDHVNYVYRSLNIPGSLPSSNSVQLESMIFSGDPSIRQFAPAKPDYYISADGLSSVPGNVTTALDSFSLRVISYNLGKAIHDSVVVRVQHTNPANATSTAATFVIRNLHNSDTSTVWIPISKVADLGINKYTVMLDAPNNYDEESEMNNSATLDLFIYSDNLVPVYPKEFDIVNQQNITLKASTLNPFRATARFRLEMDTTELFNSPLKQSATITSAGGVIKWTPAQRMTDSTVYYWRTAVDSTINGNLQWTSSSFVYLVHGSPGWNQSHFYQFKKDQSNGLVLKDNRIFRFGEVTHKYEVTNMSIGGGNTSPGVNRTDQENKDGAYVRDYWDDIKIQSASVAAYNGLQITVIDSNGRFWLNTAGQEYGAFPRTRFDRTDKGLYVREYDLSNQTMRNNAAKFLDTIPKGWYVMVKNVWWHYNTPQQNARNWAADSTVSGPGKTLYDAIKRLGFFRIDSFNRERSFIFLCKKNDGSFPLFQAMTDSINQVLIDSFYIKGSDIEGRYNSTLIGPARSWKTLLWEASPTDTLGRNDSVTVSITGVTPAGGEAQLTPATAVTRAQAKAGIPLDWINAQQYPHIRLVWYSRDSMNVTSAQLAYWRVLYTPFPEAALNPAAHYVLSDSLAQGQMQTFSTAIENLSDLPMDSMRVRYKIVGADGVTHLLADKRYRPLPALDTLHAGLTFDPSAYPGKNYLFIEANPDGDQPEQYHPNNLGYAQYKVSVDNLNPLLDVTFDGIHILNGDIVSAKPYIKIRLKDENQYLTLNDTGLLKVQLRYPGKTDPVAVPFDGSRCRFIPATKGGAANEAMVEYRPELADNGIYELSVTGADRTGNGAGAVAGTGARATYKIEFEVDNKPSITNVLNYPNPFSNATAFLFTLTGSQIPSQLKIQVLSVTGRVVREITRDELGPLHIGRNITQYQWDGRDQYGQLLGNGVYLYRVVTSLAGQDVELRADKQGITDGSGGIDRFFKGGYGKMYIMR